MQSFSFDSCQVSPIARIAASFRRRHKHHWYGSIFPTPAYVRRTSLGRLADAGFCSHAGHRFVD